MQIGVGVRIVSGVDTGHLQKQRQMRRPEARGTKGNGNGAVRAGGAIRATRQRARHAVPLLPQKDKSDGAGPSCLRVIRSSAVRKARPKVKIDGRATRSGRRKRKKTAARLDSVISVRTRRLSDCVFPSCRARTTCQW
jgi:hypothetical protein